MSGQARKMKTIAVVGFVATMSSTCLSVQIACGEDNNLDFGSKPGWHISNGSSPSASTSTTPRKPKPQTKWIPVDPGYFNNRATPGSSGASGSLMLQKPAQTGATFTVKADPEDKSNITEQVKQYIKEGNQAKGLSYLWDSKWKSKSNVDQEKMIDGLLVQLGDEKALATPLMVSHTSDAQLMKAIDNMQKLGKMPDAIELAKELEKRHPSVPGLYSNVAYLYYQSQKYNDALAYFKKADELNQKSPENLFNVMVCCTKLGLLEELQTARRAFVQRFPEDSRSADMQKQIDYYQKDFAATRQREKSGSTSVSTDYPHFSKNSMPLKVYIPDITSQAQSWESEPDLSLDYVDMVRRAADAWQDGSGGKVSFTLTSSREDANIVIDWVEDPGTMAHSTAIGTTSVISNKKGVPQHKIALLVPSKKFGGDATRFLSTTTHEFGHALGLSHSSDPADLMYNTNLAERRMTDNDKERITELYTR